MEIVVKTKTRQLADIFRYKISAGEFSTNAELPSEAELMREFNVGRSTVREAMMDLMSEGLIVKSAGKRTVAVKTRRTKTIGYILWPPDPHYNLFITTPLSLAFSTLGHTILYLDPDKLEELSLRKTALDVVMFSDADFFVYDRKALVAKLRKTYPNTQILCLFLGEGGFPKVDKVIKINIRTANYLLARKLISSGRRRLLYLCRARGTPASSGLAVQAILPGIEQAVAETRGCHLEVINDEIEVTRKKLQQLFSARIHPDAIITSYDTLAVIAAEELRNQGIPIPGDVAVAGQFNTPWCTHFVPNLTSTKIDEESAESAFRKVLDEGATEAETIMVPVFRESTGDIGKNTQP